ncbi:hypothetical protein PTKIN_Ptkin01aG0396800 [Pterospermum kingtungense]
MEIWSLILVSISITYLLKLIFNIIYPARKHSPDLPPGPIPLPIIGNLLLFRKSFSDFKPVVQSLHAKFGPIITLHFGSRPVVFIADRYLAHQALVKDGASFADRPLLFDGSNQNHVSTSFYGTKWRLLRRNLTAEILQSSRVKTYSHARKWAMERLLNCLKLQSQSGDPVRVLEHFKFSIFSLIVVMCFGEKLEDKQIKEIQHVLELLISRFSKVSTIYMTSIFPTLTRFVFRRLLDQAIQVGQQQKELFIPLIKKRVTLKEEKLRKADDKIFSSYLDKLLDLYLPEGNRKLNDDELVGLCSEFITGGSHGTITSLQWIMANLVKYPQIQEKLFVEIKGVVGNGEKLVKEDDLPKIPYLRAVILEGLRKNLPGTFLMPHSVTEDVVFNGYKLPKNGTVFFMNGDMGLDPTVWEDPMTFKPERFLNDGIYAKAIDVTGNMETKMMPFGVGRRSCPGYALAMLHLEYFVANLIWSFEWKAVGEVNMETKQEFAVTMKNPLRANLLPRF